MSPVCTISKVLEKVAFTRLPPRALSSCNFTRFQSAYSGTECALVNVVSDIELSADEGKCYLYLTFRAAFNADNHSTLCIDVHNAADIYSTFSLCARLYKRHSQF